MFENLVQKLNISPEVEKIAGIKTQISFSPVFDSVMGFLKNVGGETVIITSDSGYFSAGRELRESLKSAGESVSVFCADDGEVTSASVKEFLDSVVNAGLSVVIGNAELYEISAPVLREKNLPVLFIPSECEIGSVFCVREKSGGRFFGRNGLPGENFCDPDVIAFDEEVIEKNANKYKNYSACCYAESVRLLDFEARVLKTLKATCLDSSCFCGSGAGCFDGYAAINGLFELSQSFLQSFYAKHAHKTLLYACFVAGITKRCAFLTGVGDAAFVFSAVSAEYVRGEKVFGGELELYAARILLLIYENFLRFKFCGGGNFCLNLPGAFSASIKAEKDLGVRRNDLPDLPHYFYNDGELLKIVDALFNGDEILNCAEEVKAGFLKAADKLKSVYGGKRRAVRSVGEKIKADALYLAPFLTSGDCLIKIVCACGCLDAQSI